MNNEKSLMDVITQVVLTITLCFICYGIKSITTSIQTMSDNTTELNQNYKELKIKLQTGNKDAEYLDSLNGGARTKGLYDSPNRNE